MPRMRPGLLRLFVVATVVICLFGFELCAQQIRRKPVRAKPPTFKEGEFEGVFFDDVKKQLVGPVPKRGELSKPADSGAIASATTDVGASNASGKTNVWKDRISGPSIEDLVKEGKRRLDGFITTPAKFSAGSYKDARREFTLMAILFAAIEQYPEEIRWKNSSALARARFGRMAANAKVPGGPAFNEAKLRLEDLATLLKGTALSDTAPTPDLNWPELADRTPSMQILEWALREHVMPNTASEALFKSKSDEVLTYAELVGLIGETLHQPGMTDADDEEYKTWSKKMIAEAARIVDAVKLSNPTMAREAAGQLDQSCNGCHNTFR
jgi:hypothetical protein